MQKMEKAADSHAKTFSVCEFKSHSLQLIFQEMSYLYMRGFETYSPPFVLLPPSVGLYVVGRRGLLNVYM